MRKLVTVSLVLAVAAGCRGTTELLPPHKFPRSTENRLRYRFAVPPPKSIERHPLTLYAKRIRVQKEIIRSLDSYGRFSTCVTIPAREAGELSRELKIARKKGAEFLLRTEITRFEASLQGRNGRIFAAWPLGMTIFGLPLAWDIDAKTWRGDADMDVSVLNTSDGKKVYSSRISAESFGNFSRYDELKEKEFGKNFIRFGLGRDVLTNLMVGLVEDLNENFTRYLLGADEEGAEKTPPEEETPPPVTTPLTGGVGGKTG